MVLKYDNCPNCFAPLKGQSKCDKCGYIIDNLIINENVMKPFTILNEKYLLGRVLGQGGFGITYVAQDLMNNRMCAIKEYMPSECAVRGSKNRLEPAGENYRNIFEKGKAKFLDEARTLNKFSGDPVVVTIYDVFAENNTAYLVMELLEGVNMKALSRSYSGQIPLELAKRMLVTLAGSLTEIHKQGVLHRDISPENIFITQNGEIRLIDFGAARNYINSQNTGMSVLLKPGFAPPEQYSSQGNHGPWTDVYALAASFYTLVSGQKLIDSMLIMRGEKQPTLYELNCGVSKELSDTIARAMELNYQNRYQNCSEFLSDILKENTSVLIPIVNVMNKTNCSYQLQPGKEINIGRSIMQNDLVVDSDTLVSRQHCTLSYDVTNNVFRLVDKSANGTFLQDGQRLMRNQVYILHPGETFYLANRNHMLQVLLKDLKG